MRDITALMVLGDVIETGVWRGGTSIFMRGVMAAYNQTNRKAFVCDSFAGLPPSKLKCKLITLLSH